MQLSEQLSEGIHGHRPHLRNFRKDAVKSAGFQRIVQRDSDRMYRGPLMTHPDVAALLTDHAVASCSNARTRRSPDTQRGNFMRPRPGSVHPLRSGAARGVDARSCFQNEAILLQEHWPEVPQVSAWVKIAWPIARAK